MNGAEKERRIKNRGEMEMYGEKEKER